MKFGFDSLSIIVLLQCFLIMPLVWFIEQASYKIGVLIFFIAVLLPLNIYLYNKKVKTESEEETKIIYQYVSLLLIVAITFTATYFL